MNYLQKRVIDQNDRSLSSTENCKIYVRNDGFSPTDHKLKIVDVLQLKYWMRLFCFLKNDGALAC